MLLLGVVLRGGAEGAGINIIIDDMKTEKFTINYFKVKPSSQCFVLYEKQQWRGLLFGRKLH